MMYDPKTGKGYKANKPEDHERMDKMGYTHEKPEVEEGLWDNIHKKRERIKNGSGERMRKKGEEGAPKPSDLKKAAEDTTTASIPNPADTAMGPKFKTGRVHDLRKKKGRPLVLKRFRDYYSEKGIM